MEKFLFSIFAPIKKFLFRPAVRYRLFESYLFSPHPHELIFKYTFEFIDHHKVEGDYLEFGVWKGRSFARAYNVWKYLFQIKGKLEEKRFFAFDSFQGLPETSESPEFKKGQFFSTEKSFKDNIVRQGVDLSRVIIVPGWFRDTLNQKTKNHIDLKKAAVVLIDCDLYESAVYVLDFITDLVQDGTILIFDDWYNFKGDPNKGEQRAFREWLKKNPSVKATEWQKASWETNSFILHKTK